MAKLQKKGTRSNSAECTTVAGTTGISARRFLAVRGFWFGEEECSGRNAQATKKGREAPVRRVRLWPVGRGFLPVVFLAVRGSWFGEESVLGQECPSYKKERDERHQNAGIRENSENLPGNDDVAGPLL